MSLLLTQLVQDQVWVAFMAIVTITDQSLQPALERAQGDADLSACVDQASTRVKSLDDQLDRVAPLSGAGEPSASSEQKTFHFFRSTSKAAISAMDFYLRCSSFLRSLICHLFLGTELLKLLLLFQNQHWPLIGILRCLPPTFHLLRGKSTIMAVGTEFNGVQSSGLERHRELVGSTPTIRVFLGCMHNPSMQTLGHPAVVEADRIRTLIHPESISGARTSSLASYI